MKDETTVRSYITSGIITGLGIGACASLILATVASAQSGATGAVQVKPSAAVLAMANAPKPPATATKKTSIGKGKVMAKSADGAGDGDSYWVEEIDIDGDGTVEEADVLWDDEDKILFLHSSEAFTCRTGGVGTGDLLIAVYGQGNSVKKPAGSGFYLVELDERECSAAAAEVSGCRFDAKGNATACGVAVLDEESDDLEIVTVTK